MSDDRFNVWQDLEDDTTDCIGRNLTAEEAVNIAVSYTSPMRPANQLGIIKRVIIEACSDEATVFEWRRGEGVVFPTREQCAAAAAR